MSDLVTWLRVQLEEDQWHVDELRLSRGAHPAFAVRRHGGPLWQCTDIDRLAAEVEAKRRILDLHQRLTSDEAPDWVDARGLPSCRECDEVVEWPCPTVRLLALPYADRPGFDESWRPS